MAGLALRCRAAAEGDRYTMEGSNGYFFEETQRFDQKWLLVLMLPLIGFSLWFVIASGYVQFVQGRPFGDKPLSDGGLILADLLFLFCGIMVPVGVWCIKLVVRVNGTNLIILFSPLTSRTIPLAEIATVEARDYRPVGEFGGWGLKYSIRQRRTAYNVKGSRGVFIDLASGKKILIGSQRADDLAAAIKRAKGMMG